MDAREAYYRRAYRLALLLTDSDSAALRILERVADHVPKPERSSDARFDRAVIQSSRPVHEQSDRENSGDGLESRSDLSEDALQLWRLAHQLEPQPLEAWTLREVEGLDEVRAARAMDCSRNAMERIHLLGAMRFLQDSMGDRYAPARDEIIRSLDTLDPSHAIAHIQSVLQAHAKRSRIVTIASIIALLIFFGLLLFVLFDLMGWQDREEKLRGSADAYSNPIPAEVDDDTVVDEPGDG